MRFFCEKKVANFDNNLIKYLLASMKIDSFSRDLTLSVVCVFMYVCIYAVCVCVCLGLRELWLWSYLEHLPGGDWPVWLGDGVRGHRVPVPDCLEAVQLEPTSPCQVST